MVVGSGKKFCVEHAIIEDMDGTDRMPCPYDPKHSCYKSKLEKHLRKCNSRPKPLPDYISPKINAVDAEYPNAGQFDLDYAIGTVEDEVLIDLIQKIEEVYSEIPPCCESILSHSVLDENFSEEAYGVNTKKHLLQNSSLLKHIEENGLIEDNMIFVEFGAGKGGLTYWLAQALGEKPNCSLILIDRASHRHKSDNKLKGNVEANVLRIRADIADLDLSKIPLLQSSSKEVVGICKHLCGMATDLALRCLISAKGVKIRGLVMAFCCHHRCTWSSFVGKEFILQKGFHPKYFTALCSITSWATCGSGRSKTETYSNDCDSNKDRYSRLSLSKEARESIGRKCKMIMNYARLVHLQKAGYTGKLVYYVKEETSPENVCIIAKSW